MARTSTPTPWYTRHTELFSFTIVAFAISQIVCVGSFKDGAVSANWFGFIGHICGWFWLKLFGAVSYITLGAICLFGISLFRSTEKMVNRFFALTIGTISFTLLFSILSVQFPILETTITPWLGFSLQQSHASVRLGGIPMYYLYAQVPHINLHYLLNTGGSLVIAFMGLATSAIIICEHNLQASIDRLRSRVKAKKKQTPVFAKIEESPQESLPLLQSLRNRLQKKSENHALQDFKGPPFLSHDLEDIPPSFSNIPDSLKALSKKSGKQTIVPQIQEAPKLPIKKSGDTRKVSLEDPSGYTVPGITHLNTPKKNDLSDLKKELKQKADLLEETLLSFGIEAKVGQIYSGPTITSFEVHPAVGVKVGRIKTLEHDIALNLEAKSIRIIAPIPGKAAVGIEVPNKNPQEVSFQEIISAYYDANMSFRIPLLLGKGANGDLIMTDLTKMPHCIIAGATGSGKSVCINTIVMSIVMTAKPDEIKLLMIDPKKVELTPYSDLPHMLAPVITEPQSASLALNWLVKEMEKRYEMLKLTGQRNIDAFNKRNIDHEFEQSLHIEIPEKLAYYVAIIDELADLMMIASQDIETPIARIAQMARAVGIHMILATQRPSREVITGLIKANFPSRIAFKVASRVNSQIILDDIGAETLLGNGDMLVQLPGSSQLIRAQGAFVRDEEIQRVIDVICKQAPPQYIIASFEKMQYELHMKEMGEEGGPSDALYNEAKSIVLATGNASTTFLQRKLKVGYARAAALMDELENFGIVGPQEGAKPRKIFHPSDRRDDPVEIYDEV